MKKRILSLLLVLVMVLGIFPVSAMATAQDSVEVRILNETCPVDNESCWSGTEESQRWHDELVRKSVPVTSSMSAMDAIAAALEDTEYTAKGLDAGYISEIAGLHADLSGSSMAGWMITVNDWFINEGADTIPVTSGDVVRVMFSMTGNDLGGSWDNNDKSLKGLSPSAGTLEPAFSPNTTAYTLTLDGAATVQMNPEAANKNFQVRTFVGDDLTGTGFRPQDSLSLQDGDTVHVVVGGIGWPSMNNQAGGTSDNVPAMDYTISVVTDKVPDPQPDLPEDAVLLPGYIFSDSWNTQYDVLYHEENVTYGYEGQIVTFPDGDTVMVGDTSHDIKNKETVVSAETAEGKTTLTFSNLTTPVGSISGEWNANYSGKFALHYNVNGTEVTPTVADCISNVKLVVDTPEAGQYHLTDGRIYEAANEYSGGHDFGDGKGVVTSRVFGYLPELTITVEGSAEPEPDPWAKPVPQPSARIGDKSLTVTEVENPGYNCNPLHTYEITVPESLKDQEVTITGVEGYTYREAKKMPTCWGSLVAPFPRSVLVIDTAYHLHDLNEQYETGYSDIHIQFKVEPETVPEPPKPDVAPFTAVIDGQQAEIVKKPGAGTWGRDIYVIQVPTESTATHVTITGLNGFGYIKNSTTGLNIDVSNSWSAEILDNEGFYSLSNWDTSTHFELQFYRAPVQSIRVSLTAQAEGAFRLPPETEAEVYAGLAASQSYPTAQGVEGITAMDALVKLHQDIFGKEDVTPYLTVSDQGRITSIFGLETAAVGFTVNGSITETGINETVLHDGDDLSVFVYQDASDYSDKLVWLEQNGTAMTQFIAKSNQPLTITVKTKSRDGDVSPVSGAQLAEVDAKGNITPIDGAITDDEGHVTLTFSQVTSKTITVTGTEASGKIVMPVAYVKVNEAMKPDAPADSTVPDDFENDLWLQYDFLEMKVNDKADLYPRRVEQIIDNYADNNITRPTFHFERVYGSSVELDTTASSDKAVVTAKEEGISIVKVTYDAYGEYGASSSVNTAYVVYDVNSHPANLTISTSMSAIRSYDTIYYTEGDSVSFPFTVSVPDAQSIEVTCNGHVLEGKDGSYTAQLENRNNVLGITATSADGRVKTRYQTIDARKIAIQIDNLTHPGQSILAGDEVKVSFRGITMPVYKLATIYNPCMGSNSTRVLYTNETVGQVKGQCSQYDLATKNDFTVTFNEPGDYRFTDGKIFCAWWGSPLGSDKSVYGKGDPNFSAPVLQDHFSQLPDFTITVEEKPQVPSVDYYQLAREDADGAAAWISNRYAAKSFVYGNEWDVFALTRSGHSLTEDQIAAYLDSVEAQFKGSDVPQKPTDLARVTLTLGVLGQDAADFRGINLVEQLSNSDRIENGTSNEAIWALIALDTRAYSLAPNAKWSRETLIDKILSFQLENGGFPLQANKQADLDMTSMAIQALAPYYASNATAKASVDKALEYLKQFYTKKNCNMGSSEATAQLLVALTALKLDPVNLANGFATQEKNPITDLLTYRNPATGAFKHSTTSQIDNNMATQQSTYALESYCRFAKNQNRLYDLTDVRLDATLYSVIITPSENGTVKTDKTRIAPGDEVTLTIIPNNGFELDTLLVGGSDFTARVKNNRFAFPYHQWCTGDVTVTATFLKSDDVAKTIGESMSSLHVTRADKETYQTISNLQTAYDRLNSGEQATIQWEKNHFDQQKQAYDTLLHQAAQAAKTRMERKVSSLDKKELSRQQIEKIDALLKRAKAQVGRCAYTEQIDAAEQQFAKDLQDLLRKTMKVTFRLIGDTRHDTPSKHTGYVTWIPTEAYEIKEGDTVYDVFTKAIARNSMSQKGADSNYVSSIRAPRNLGGFWLGEFDNGPNSGWMYMVNGIHPNLGLKEFHLHAGDDIVWHYVDDYTVEENNDSWMEGDNSQSGSSGGISRPETPAKPTTPVKPGQTVTETKPDGTKLEASMDTQGNITITETKPDGTIIKSEETATGDKTITETKPDGSSVKSEEKANGDKAITETAKDGSSVKTEDRANGDAVVTKTAKDGSAVSEGKKPDGTTAKSITNVKGQTKAEVKVSSKAVEIAQKENKPVEIPLAPVEVQKEASKAPVVKIEIKGSGADVKVSIPVANPMAGTVAVIVHADGTEEIVRKSTVGEAGVGLKVENGTIVKIVDNTKNFADVPSTHWANDSIAFVSSRELFNGTTTNTFTPSAKTTRGQIMTVLARLEGADTSENPIQKGMEWAVQAGISDGANPQGTISRQQLATMLWRLAGRPESTGELPHSDSGDVADYAQQALAWAVEQGIMSGYADGTLKPTAEASRAHVAAMVMRYVNK